MACSGCKKRTAARRSGNIMDQHRYLNNRQLMARLEVYKNKYCKNCEKKEKCTYETYVSCKKSKE